MLSRLRSLLHALMHRTSFEAGMSEELQFHIEQYEQDLVRSGVSAQEARRRARLEFGSQAVVEEECREARGLRVYDSLRRELRQALRSLRKAPAFSATAILTVAICLGANLTIFAVVDAILIRPLPFPQADRLATIFNTYPRAGVDRDGSSVTNYYERRDRLSAFQAIALYSPGSAIVGDSGATERAPIMRVTPEFFDVLGTRLALGRAFTDEELTYQTGDVVILTDVYWQRQLRASPRAIGESVRIDGVSHTIIGILPPDFRFLSSTARLYVPLASRPEDRTPQNRHSGGNAKHMIGRLADGLSFPQAQAEVDAQNVALEADSPTAAMMADAGFRSVVASLHADHVAEVRSSLLLTQFGALALLLIGAVNLLNLLLIRANGRAWERDVRRALGASSWNVVVQAAVETSVVTVAGGFLGLALAAAGIGIVAAWGVDQLPLGARVALNARLGVAALAAAVGLGLALAAPIAWLNLHRQPGGGLRAESRGGTPGYAAQQLRHAFLMGQIALALTLLTGTGLLALSLQRTRAVDPGFQSAGILTAQVSLPYRNYPNGAARQAFFDTVLTKLEEQPGVVTSGLSTNIPLSGHDGKSAAKVKGHSLRPGESPRGRYSYGVSGDYFQALGFTLVEGRFLTADDARKPERVCVVDEDFAREYWPEGGAVGRLLFQGPDDGPDDEAFTIVGVVGAVKQVGLGQNERQGAIYYPFPFRADGSAYLTVRTSVPPETIAGALREAVSGSDPDLPATGVRSMESRIADSLAGRRTPTAAASLFSAMALLLSAVGIYGVTSYAVSQRRREIGVRMALGARPSQIRSQFLGTTLRLLCVGLMLGLAGGALTARAMRAVLFETSNADWPIFAAAAGVMAAVSLLAALLPSNRAAQTAPTESLADG